MLWNKSLVSYEFNRKFNISQSCNINLLTYSHIYVCFSYNIHFRKQNINVLINKISSQLSHKEIFFVFSSIFVGTLLLYGNYSYRLVFLVPAITVVIMNFQITSWRKNPFVFELLIISIMLYLSPFVPRIGWYLPQFFAFILGVYFFSVISLNIFVKLDNWFKNQNKLRKN